MIGDLRVEEVITKTPEETTDPGRRAGRLTLGAKYGPQLSIRTIAAPIDAFVGTHDPDVTEEEMRYWAEVTRSDFAARAFPGDHFYLHQSQTELLRNIGDRLN